MMRQALDDRGQRSMIAASRCFARGV